MDAVCVIPTFPVEMRHLSPQLLEMLAADDSELTPSVEIDFS
jgi:hypothetical protein